MRPSGAGDQERAHQQQVRACIGGSQSQPAAVLIPLWWPTLRAPHTRMHAVTRNTRVPCERQDGRGGGMMMIWVWIQVARDGSAIGSTGLAAAQRMCQSSQHANVRAWQSSQGAAIVSASSTCGRWHRVNCSAHTHAHASSAIHTQSQVKRPEPPPAPPQALNARLRRQPPPGRCSM